VSDKNTKKYFENLMMWKFAGASDSIFWAPGRAAPGSAVASVFFARKRQKRTRPFASLAQSLRSWKQVFNILILNT